jgi:hypothetical protein
MKNLQTKKFKLRITGYVFLFLLIGGSCADEVPACYKSEGTLIGLDARACACCGGWLITIDRQTYNFQMPSSSQINAEADKFPLKVKLNWKFADDAMCGNWIIVTRIMKI